MVSECEPRPGQETPDTAEEKNEEIAKLPAEFFLKLVNQPSCLSRGECDGCGRCEH